MWLVLWLENSPVFKGSLKIIHPKTYWLNFGKMFEKPPAVEIYDLVDALHSCKQAPGKPVSEHVLEMKGLMDQLHTLGKPYDNDMAANYQQALEEELPLYLEEFACNIREGFKVERKLSYGVQYLQVGNGTQAAVESHRNVCGCEAYVNVTQLRNSNRRSVKYGDFLERDLISQEFSGRDYDLEDDHMDTLPSENTSEILVEPESLGSPSELIPVRRSERTKRAPNRLCLNMEVEDDEVASGKLKDALKTMIDYEETFSPVADIRAIRILIAIAAYYDYEIWQMDHHVNGNKRFDEEIKKFGFIQNRDEPCVYRKASGSDVVFLILYVDDILIMGNNIPRLKEVKDYLGKMFSVKDLGEAAYILGIKIYRDRSLWLIGLCNTPEIRTTQRNDNIGVLLQGTKHKSRKRP
ncbi:retrotransposon protein, putative, ty1-copia subclass [Tanacetum coccineum]